MRAARLEVSSRCPACDLSALPIVQTACNRLTSRTPLGAHASASLRVIHTARPPVSIKRPSSVHTRPVPTTPRICRPSWLSPSTSAQYSVGCPASSTSHGLVSIFLSSSGVLYASPSPRTSRVYLHLLTSVRFACPPRLTECGTEQCPKPALSPSRYSLQSRASS